MRLLIATFVALATIARAQITQLCEYCPYYSPCRGLDGGCYEMNWDIYACPERTTHCPEDARCRSSDGECYWEEFDDETGNFQCPEGTARCPACINSILSELDPNAIDDGCPPSTPVCVDDTGDSPPFGDPGTTCVAKCFDTSRSRLDRGCPQGLPFCTSWDGSNPEKRQSGSQCGLCSRESCDDKDPSTYDYCDPSWGCSHWAPYDVVCTDTSRSGMDKGCNQRFPRCMSVDGTNPGPGKSGVWCVCTPDSCDDTDPSTEDICYEYWGCNNGNNWDGFDGPVTKCVDTSRSGNDRNCPKSRPICTLSDGSDPGQNNPGVRCAKCSPGSCDDNDPSTGDYCARDEGCYHWDDSNFWGPVGACVDTSISGTDKGCTKSHPICTLNDASDPGVGKAGVMCSACSQALCDDNDPSTEDFCYYESGCHHWDGSNFWGPVVDCVDTSISGTDKGCTKSQPICALRDRSDPGTGKAGVQCSVCSLALCDDGDPSTDDFCDPQFDCYYLPKETCGAVSGEPQQPWMCADPLPSCTRDEWCYCITDVEGNPFCAEDNYCMYANSCTSSDECGSNMKCVSGCCGSGSGSCLYDCGSDNGYGRRLHGYGDEPTVLGFIW